MHIHALLVCSLCYNANTVQQRGAVNEREEERESDSVPIWRTAQSHQWSGIMGIWLACVHWLWVCKSVCVCGGGHLMNAYWAKEGLHSTLFKSPLQAELCIWILISDMQEYGSDSLMWFLNVFLPLSIFPRPASWECTRPLWTTTRWR